MPQVNGAKLAGVPEGSGLCRLPLPSPRNESTPLWLGHFYPSQKQPAQPGLPALAATAPASPALLGRLSRLQPPPSLPARPPVHLSVCLSFLLCVPVLLCGSLTLDLAFPTVHRLVRDSVAPAAEGGQSSHWCCRLGSWHPRAATALGTAGAILSDTAETWARGPCRPCLWGQRPCGSQDSSSRVHRACHSLLPERPPQLPTPHAGRKSHSRCQGAQGLDTRRSGQGGG